MDIETENSEKSLCAVNFDENTDIPQFEANLNYLGKQILILQLMKQYNSISARN